LKFRLADLLKRRHASALNAGPAYDRRAKTLRLGPLV
jgi:hypothetical protein